MRLQTAKMAEVIYGGERSTHMPFFKRSEYQMLLLRLKTLRYT